MTIQKNDLLTLDYSYDGLPFYQVVSGTQSTLVTYSYNGLPYIAAFNSGIAPVITAIQQASSFLLF